MNIVSWFAIQLLVATLFFLFLILSEEGHERYGNGEVTFTWLLVSIGIGSVIGTVLALAVIKNFQFSVNTFVYLIPIMLGFLFGHLYYEGYRTDRYVKRRAIGEAYSTRLTVPCPHF